VDLSKIYEETVRYSIKAALTQYMGQEGKIHYVVHNAAIITPLGPEVFVNPSEENNILATLTTNNLAPALLTNMLSPFYMVGTRILYVSSIAGDRPGGQTGCYSMSKAFGDRFIQTQQKDQPMNGKLLFASVNPGNVETDIHIKDLRSPKEGFTRAAYFQQFTGQLTPPTIVGLYLKWLLVDSVDNEFTNEHKDWDKRKHNIYDPHQQKHWWRGDVIVDPYLAPTIVSPSTLSVSPDSLSKSISSESLSNMSIDSPHRLELGPPPSLPIHSVSSPPSPSSQKPEQEVPSITLSPPIGSGGIEGNILK